MSFTGKATYSAGATLPESAEDVSDLITLNSPHETPLLDAIGDSQRVAPFDCFMNGWKTNFYPTPMQSPLSWIPIR